ncbi:unnamed protein product [Urochloa humidicola]
MPAATSVALMVMRLQVASLAMANSSLCFSDGFFKMARHVLMPRVGGCSCVGCGEVVGGSVGGDQLLFTLIRCLL